MQAPAFPKETLACCTSSATIMSTAKAALGSKTAGPIDLVAINANPNATAVPAQQLWPIYHRYNAYGQVSANGDIVHDPLTLIIDATGHERLKFETLASSDKADLNDQEVGLEDGMRQWLPQA